ncbi:hypothetical protein VW29_05030 [Devosia limi DSM 17137]|uniref:2,5-diketo-D-gluconate reductase A n=1 Tax=Devosia limi DSM 17137 TaxID=1121477 RepID=A0A0F5LUW9_9HYPH|nr:aldo/keto reductase [Devosia limi]KKB85969.1 hypothetical protein VW29_05030 [Devosia limi DSM 17137]SHF00135.1 2,5-diketo-D-gluconate reductase A [Devosia limi DSM 17137]
MTSIPNIALNDGYDIPQIGLGVWQIDNDKVGEPVRAAIDAGYRHIDTAQGYGNESGVGRGIARNGIDRDELFITSKLRTRDQGYDNTLRSFMGSLDRLEMDYLDLFLIHWPVPEQDKYADTWRAFVQLQRDGRIRSIGVSNFLPEHIERIVDKTGVVPAINQVETHPYYQQRAIRDFHTKHRIALESYSPLGGGAVLGDRTIGEIALKHGKSPAQAIIRWHLQEGLIAIPKSAHADRIKANLEVFDFELDAEDLRRIAALDRPDGKKLTPPEQMNDLF